MDGRYGPLLRVPAAYMDIHFQPFGYTCIKVCIDSKPLKLKVMLHSEYYFFGWHGEMAAAQR